MGKISAAFQSGRRRSGGTEMCQEGKAETRGTFAANTTNIGIDIVRVHDFCATPKCRLRVIALLSLTTFPCVQSLSGSTPSSTHHHAGRSEIGAVRSFTTCTATTNNFKGSGDEPAGHPQSSLRRPRRGLCHRPLRGGKHHQQLQGDDLVRITTTQTLRTAALHNALGSTSSCRQTHNGEQQG